MVVALVVLAGNAWGAKAVVPAQGVAAVAAKEVKVLFFGNSAGPLDETSNLQPMLEWRRETQVGKTTLQEMIQNGWTIQSVIPQGNSQMFFIFTR